MLYPNAQRIEVLRSGKTSDIYRDMVYPKRGIIECDLGVTGALVGEFPVTRKWVSIERNRE